MSPKQETPPINGSRCSFDQKRKGCLYKAGMNQSKSYKGSNLLLWKFILQKPLSTTAARFFQLLNSVLNFVENEELSLCRKRWAATIKPKSLLMILQNMQFNLFCVQKMILYVIVARISKRQFFRWHCALHCRREHRDLWRLWLWYYLLPWNS